MRALKPKFLSQVPRRQIEDLSNGGRRSALKNWTTHSFLIIYSEEDIHRRRKSVILPEPKRHFGLACFLSDHLFRILVFPNSEKHRLSQPIIPSPFREFDWQTMTGLTQTHRFISATVNPGSSPRPVAGRLKNGQNLTAILFSSSDRVFRSFSLNPVPTLPANLSLPFSLTPTRSAPICFRSPAGWVQPPITNESCW